MPRPTAAIAYTRVSTERQADEGVSLDLQEARIRAYAAMTGLEIVETIREAGVSAAAPLAERPGGAAVLSLLRAGRAAHVVALKLDRLFRDAADALTTARDWDRAGIALHMIDVGGATISTASAMGRMFLTMMAGFAELERNLISERTRGAMAHKKARGERVGMIPFGYSLDAAGRLVEHPARAEALRLIAELSERGIPVRHIADIVAADTGLRIGKSTVHRLSTAFT